MTRVQIGNSELISKVNSRLVLQAVRVSQPTYRAAVARATGLKPATVTYIVEDLIRQNLLQEKPAAATSEPRDVPASRWGRPPTAITFGGTSLVTTLPAPTMLLSPIATP